MHAIRSFALLLFAVANTAWGQADLQVISSASPTTGLEASQDVLVTTTIRNNGPNGATSVSGSLSLASQESFWFQFVGSETPGCVIEPIDINPPTFLLTWSYPSLAAGQEQTCVARLRVQFVPPGNTTQLFAGADSSTLDPTSGNNIANLPLFFSTVSGASHTIPSTSTWGLALLAIGALSIAFLARSRGRA